MSVDRLIRKKQEMKEKKRKERLERKERAKEPLHEEVRGGWRRVGREGEEGTDWDWVHV